MSKFLKDIFSEANGKYSFSRTMAFILTMSYLFAFFYKLVLYNEVIDIPNGLAILIGGLYGLNKFGSALETKLYSNNATKSGY